MRPEAPRASGQELGAVLLVLLGGLLGGSNPYSPGSGSRSPDLECEGDGVAEEDTEQAKNA